MLMLASSPDDGDITLSGDPEGIFLVLEMALEHSKQQARKVKNELEGFSYSMEYYAHHSILQKYDRFIAELESLLAFRQVIQGATNAGS